jgi:hypothetical protein
MLKKEQDVTKGAWGRWCVAAKMMAVVLLLTAVAALLMTIVEYIGTHVASWLVK